MLVIEIDSLPESLYEAWFTIEKIVCISEQWWLLIPQKEGEPFTWASSWDLHLLLQSEAISMSPKEVRVKCNTKCELDIIQSGAQGAQKLHRNKKLCEFYVNMKMLCIKTHFTLFKMSIILN